MIILEGIAFAGAMLITAALGVPVAVSATQPHIWRRPAARDRASGRTSAPHRVQFTPLDLGPDPVKWPSERNWERLSTIPTPEWPSRSWDDEHFGKHWKGLEDVQDRGFHAMAGRRVGETPTPAPATARAQPAPARPQGSSSGRKPAQTTRRSAAPAPQQKPKPKPKPSKQQQPQQQRREPAPAQPQRRGPPDEAEVEHLIATVGLAGTVQAIMARTGWEFREAAQYLARVRR